MKSIEHSLEPLLPFETLLEHLQRQGFHIGVEHHIRLSVLLEQVGDSWAPSELKTLLCPLFATNGEQQSLFYRTFDSMYPFLIGAEQGKVDPKPASSVASQPSVIPSLPSLAARALVLLILAALVVWKSTTIRTNTKSRPGIAPTVAAIPAPPPPVSPIPGTPALALRRRIWVAGKVQEANLIRKVDPVYPLEARQAGAEDAVRFNAVIGNDGRVQDLEVVSGQSSLVEPARLAVRQWIYKPTLLDGAPVEVATQIDVNPPPPLARAPEPTWYSSQKAELQWIMVLVPILLWLSYEVYRFQRQRLLIRKAQGKTPPYSWPIRTDFVPEIYDPHDLAMVSRALHRRYQGESGRLDVAGTVEASVAALGFPTFRYRKDSRLPEYLFLIDRASFRDHQAHLYEHLASVLRGQGLYVSAYFYEGDPRVCWSSGAESVYLEQLQHNCAGHRLVIFGNGDQLLDAVTGRIVQWQGLLTAWPERALLTPEAPSQWGARELTLSTQFAIAPATLKGLLAVAGYFELPLSMEFSNWDGPGVQVHIDSSDVTRVLRRYLGEHAFQWLCACAIYPDLQWDLTLCLGALPSMVPGLVCEENIVKLLWLEWFRSGSMPDSLRRALIAQLNPETEREVRAAIVGLLESNPPPQGTFAGEHHRFQIAYQHYRNNPKDRKASRHLKALLKNLPADEVIQDFAYMDAAESVSRSPLKLVLPRRLLKAFYPSGVPLFGMWAYARMLLVAGLVLVSLQLLRLLNGPGTTIAAEIQTSPRDAAVTVAGPVTSATMTGSGSLNLTSGWKYDVVVSRPGYETFHEPAKVPMARWQITLHPAPMRLEVSTSETAATLFIDNRQRGELLNGKLDLEIPAEGAGHSVILRNGSTQILSFNFVAKLGETPRVRDLKPNDLFVVSSLGGVAIVYSGLSTLSASVIGQGLFVEPISAEAVKLSGLSIGDKDLVLGKKNLPKVFVDAAMAPVLYVELNKVMQLGAPASRPQPSLVAASASLVAKGGNPGISAADAAAGKAVYNVKCNLCHGADGEGNPAMFKLLSAELKPLSASTADVIDVITKGKGKMKPVLSITGTDLDNLVAYVRALKK